MRLEVDGSEGSRAKLDEDLVPAIAELLDLEPAEIEANSNLTFIQLGGDSVKALELTFKLDAAGKSVQVETILERESSISILSLALQHSSDDISETPNADVDERADHRGSQDHSKTSVDAKGSHFFDEACQRLGCSSRDIEYVLHLTSQQRGLWLGSLQAPGAYLSRWRYRIAADVDVEKLLRAWTLALNVHPILRTRILSLSDSELHQVTFNAEYYESTRDLFKIDNVVAEEGTSLFGISINDSTQPRSIDIVCHHALYDRWSMRLVLQDVQLAYKCDEVPSPPPSYLPFIRYLDEHSVKGLQDVWKGAFDVEPTTPAPIVSAPESFALTSNSVEGVVQMNSPRHATVAEIMTAAWSLVCSKHCGSPRVSFGLTVSGRGVPLSDVGKMSFPTFNTVPFVADVLDVDTVVDLLTRTKSRLASLRRIQHVDVGTIAAINSNCYNACRFNSILVVQQDVSSAKGSESALFENDNLISLDTKQSAPLVLECTPKGKEIVLSMKYDPTCIETIEAETMMSHFKAAFDRLSSEADEALTNLSLFGKEDVQLIRQWVKPDLSLVKTTLHAMVEEAASVRPDSIAIWQTDMTLTYGDLISQSRSVMRRILSEHAGASPNIGVCIEKSAYAVVAMLGASMAGRTFVPIDASNPFNRIMQIVKNAQISLLLCSSSTAPRFKETDIEVLIVDEPTYAASHTAHENPLVDSNPESSVYIIYTSGSTGEPKGVVLTQQALCTTLKAISKHLEFSTDTRSLQFSSFAFDMSVHDIWCTFLAGGVVCMPIEAERFELGDFISRSKCNYAMLTPSVALTLTDREWAMFEKLSVSGEPLQKAVIRGALQAGVKFWNTYGPTESCIICLTEQVKTMETSPSKLGYSFAASSWIIDADDPHRLAPVGCLGELALSGHTLALGYYHDELKTDSAFVAGLEWTKHFPDHALDRVYRTGDLARYNYDGSIEFGGRLGGYIKIAGNRVDLGEVEETLHSKCNLPKVSVQYCQVGQDDARDMLVSFCAVPGAKQSDELLSLPMTTELESKVFEAFSKLRELLPNYMIPVAFIPVNRLPYNTAGKLDKKRLVGLVTDTSFDEVIAAYGIDVQTSEKEQDEPRATEHDLSSQAALLRDIWVTVLNTKADTISSQSNFFRLGGDSLRALNLVATLRSSNHSISVAEIFRFPKLNEMALRIKNTPNPSGSLGTLPAELWSRDETRKIIAHACKSLQLTRDQIQSVLPCTSLQIQMLASSAQSSSTYLHRECFKLTADVTASEVEEVFRRLAAENELLRSKATVDQETGQFVLVILEASSPIHFVRQKGSIRSYVHSSSAPLGIERDLTRFVLLEGDEERVLVWEVHHCIYDGYSMVLLMQQIRDQILRCRETPRPATKVDPSPTPRFEDFVRYINQADKQTARDFWSQYLHDAPKLDLAFAKSPGHDRCRDFVKNKTATRELEFKAPRSTITTAVYIRAAFAITLSQYTTSADVVFSATNHGRDLPVDGIENLAGPTFSTLPVRCIIDKDETLSAMLSRIQVEAANIASYQYLSPEEISSIDASCEQACKVLVHLLIQSAANGTPVQELKDLGYSIIPDVAPMNLPIPLSLVATPKKGSITFDVIYNEALFSSQQIDLLLDQFSSNVVRVLTSKETMLVREVYDLGETNRKAYLDIQPKIRHQDSLAGLTIPDLIFRNLQARNADQALYSTQSSFTYQDVFEHASSLAQDLVERVGSKHRYIAVCYEKSPWAVMAQLGVLMAGHAYVSVDNAWPKARRQAVLSQIDCPMIIASLTTSQDLGDSSVQIMVFDASYSGQNTLIEGAPTSRAHSEDAAYVIFTSGSTGTPKGVVVQHEAICRTISAYSERLHFTHETRSLLFASFSFDASVMETWSILAAGGVLCIADEEERISDLDGFIIRSQADCVALTPTSAMLLDSSRVKSIKTLLFCGEKCQPKDLERWTRSDLTLANGYGPSETSVNAVMNTQFSRDDLANIGESMGGGLWIVNPDDCNELVPVGGVGELLVTGPVLAKEYLNDLEKTAQNFVPLKWPDWTQVCGQRAYRTGDLVQLGTDRCLRFIGRYDGQMKINGVRIEADEIETAAHDSDIDVDGVAVGTYATAGANHELVLFFARSKETRTTRVQIIPLQRDHEPPIASLLEHLSACLPPTHVPNLYVPVCAIPRTENGKKDRKALSRALAVLHPAQINLYRPTQNSAASQQTNDGTLPPASRTAKEHLSPVESMLASLWSQVLPRTTSDGVSFTQQSHFIRAGGDSVSAIKMSSLARSQGIEMPVGLIYSNPVLADMASALDRTKNDPTDALLDLASPSPFSMLDIDAISPVLSRGGPEGRGAQTDYFNLSRV